MQKRILFMLILGVGVLACAQVFAGPTTEVKSSPLFQASLEVSIAKLEGTPVAEAGAVAEDAENEADTHRPNCPKPGALETDGSGNTCQSSCNGTCSATCGGSNTCGGSTCGGNTCSSTCASTCVPGACEWYKFKGQNAWYHYDGSPSSGTCWFYGCLPHGFGPNSDEIKVSWYDQSISHRFLDVWNFSNGTYDVDILRTTTTAGYELLSGVTIVQPGGSWFRSDLTVNRSSTSSVNTNNFVHIIP